MSYEIHEECGVMGVWGSPDSCRQVAMGLFAMQHRGQESSGVATTDGKRVLCTKRMGLVHELNEELAERGLLPGHASIGHVRYSTAGGSTLINAQPFLITHKRGSLAIAHNGNLVNAAPIRREMEEKGHIFQSSSDTEVILHLIARSPEADLTDAVRSALSQIKGSYCLVLLSEDRMIVARDPMGVRPLCLGRKDDAWLVASESCAFDLVGATYVREVEPGEVLVINHRGAQSIQAAEPGPRAHCIFEYVYFSRPDSIVFGHSCDKVRRRLGKRLAIEAPAVADIVMAVPDSSNTAALGYAQQSGLRFEIGLLRNHYVGRTFIDPQQSGREFKVKLKFNPIVGVIKGKRIVLIDDSIVRGTTLRSICRIIREAGAAEIHVRISSPPVRHPCFYGMDFPTVNELLASNMTVEETTKYLGIDSLGYLSIEGMKAAAPELSQSFCTGCFSGQYPDPLLNDSFHQLNLSI